MRITYFASQGKGESATDRPEVTIVRDFKSYIRVSGINPNDTTAKLHHETRQALHFILPYFKILHRGRILQEDDQKIVDLIGNVSSFEFELSLT